MPGGFASLTSPLTPIMVSVIETKWVNLSTYILLLTCIPRFCNKHYFGKKDSPTYLYPQVLQPLPLLRVGQSVVFCEAHGSPGLWQDQERRRVADIAGLHGTKPSRLSMHSPAGAQGPRGGSIDDRQTYPTSAAGQPPAMLPSFYKTPTQPQHVLHYTHLNGTPTFLRKASPSPQRAEDYVI